jgi:UDP:flavonoid glycosyltransferase YjiC (YdhE family)
MSLAAKTILFAWELGEGLGHLPPLKAIARAAKADGARPVFALRDPVQTRAALAETGAQILPAPFWPTPMPPPAASGSYADILLGNGYGAAANLRALLAAWGEVIDLVKPDLIVCEHAPSAALSAFGRIPVAFVGNGFVVPPADGAEFPPYERGRGEPQRQRPVLAVIQEALAQLGGAAPTAITEPFRGAFRGIYAFPELDTYRHARREKLLGPIEPVPPLSPLPAKRKLFAYSAADYALAGDVTQALMDLGAEASAYFRGALGARAAVIRSRGVQLYDTAPALASVLPEASVVFSHGGTGFTNAAFAAGRPHVVNPRHFEARATAGALEELGAGICVHPFEAKRFREAVARANTDGAMREAAQKAGAAAQAFVRQATPLETTMAGLRKIFA